MTEAMMQNFTIPHIVIMITSVIIGIVGVKHALSGSYRKLKWFVLIVAVFFVISMLRNIESKLYLIPMVLALLAIFIVELLVDQGLIEKRGDYEEMTLEKAEARFMSPSGKGSLAEIEREYEEARREKEEAGLLEPKPEIVDAEIVEETTAKPKAGKKE